MITKYIFSSIYNTRSFKFKWGEWLDFKDSSDIEVHAWATDEEVGKVERQFEKARELRDKGYNEINDNDPEKNLLDITELDPRKDLKESLFEEVGLITEDFLEENGLDIEQFSHIAWLLMEWMPFNPKEYEENPYTEEQIKAVARKLIELGFIAVPEFLQDEYRD